MMRRSLVCMGLIAAILGISAAPAATADASTANPAAIGPLATETIPGRWIPAENYFIPPHVGNGDRDFAGHGPNIFVKAYLLGIGTNSLSVQLFMDAKETEADFTRASGWSDKYLIYVAPAGQCIRSVSRGDYDELRFIDHDKELTWLPGQVEGSFVRVWNVMGDTSGNDAGIDTGVAVATYSFTANVQSC